MYSGRRNLTALFRVGQALALVGIVSLVVSAQESTSKSGGTKAKSAAAPTAKKAVDKSGSTADAQPVAIKLPEKVFSTGYTGSFEELIGFVNQQIREGWVANNVEPAEVADDGEWVRRVHLDIVGHTPDLETVEKFLADKNKSKRAELIDRLLDEPGYARNYTTIWTNLLIGRATRQDRISREDLQKFLRQSFAKNRAWSEVVYDLLSAEGRMDENGATNFLMAHLNDGAVPATAISAKLFLGMQVQCTQCHNHPFNDWKQDQFWEFNSFFKQARRQEHRKYNEKTGRMDFDYSELVPVEFEGPVYFEKRNGLMQVAYPKFAGAEVNPDKFTNRRLELAKLVVQGDKPLIADALVNRMWGHFFGYGFTKPVDDMGPHNPPSNPVLLERLAREFSKVNYDVKHLIRWICNSEAYNLTSRMKPANMKDNPAAGETPMFSHMYVKSMTAEQLYDSLIIATNAHKAGRSNWESAEAQRQRWLGQFFQTFGTDENDEATSFDGTIPQALTLMNGELVENAISNSKGSLLNDVLTSKSSDAEKIKKLYLATLSRTPSQSEIKTATAILKSTPLEAYQDLYWALLNSNEFIFIH
jgi:hypothetical protein